MRPNRVILHLVTLPRWFAAPVVVLAVLLGWLLGGGSGLGLAFAILAGLSIMSALHSLNTWTDWVTGVDKPGGSVEKVYTAGSQVIAVGWMRPKEVLANVLAFFLLAVLFTGLTALVAGNWWPFYALGLALVFGGLYSPVWKYHFLPEACGLCAFGVGGVSLGYAVGGGLALHDLGVTLLVGIAIGMPFALAWSVDQLYDAKTDIQRGVRNIGGLLHSTGMSCSSYLLFGIAVSWVFQLFLISQGLLSPWSFLSILSLPLWVVCAAWTHEKLDRAAIVGLAAIFLYEGLLVAGQALA